MTHLRKFLAPEFIFGKDARLMAGRYAINMGARRPLLVSDPRLRAAGWVEEAMRGLTAEGLAPALFLEISPNPRADEVMAGIEAYHAERCDVIIALGGGSVIDGAKAIGILAANGGHILDYEGVDKVALPGPPLLCIPTTAGSAADVSQFAVVTDMLRRRKITIISKTVVPDVSLIDPVPTSTMDAPLTAGTGLDALVHAIEAFVSRANSPVVDLHALEAVRLVRRHLPAVLTAPSDLAGREQMMRASMHAGLAFSNASLGAVHAMAHGLGGAFDLPHGESNAPLLEHVLSFNYPAAPERYDRIGEALGLNLAGLDESGKAKAIRADLGELKRLIGLDGSLGQRGIGRGDVAELARHAATDVCLVTNPRPLNRRDIEFLYEEAL